MTPNPYTAQAIRCDMNDDDFLYEDDDLPIDGELCGDCDGEGYVLADCFEDTCCCADPESEHGYSVCPTCGGTGLA